MPILPRLLLTAAVVGTALPIIAAPWPHWRGPQWNGATTESQLPTRFSKTERVKWAAALPGPGAATPVIWENQVFISTTDETASQLLAQCYDTGTGKLLWQHSVGERIRRDNRSYFAAPSPVTDGRHVWFFYSDGTWVGFDLQGKEIWRRNIQDDNGEFAFLWTFSSSPTLLNGRLYLQVLQRDVPVSGRGRTDGPNDSYILAVDPATGKELWREIRPSQARAESREAFSSPIPYTHEGRTDLLVLGGDCLTGHALEDGKERWRWGTYNPQRIGHWRLVASPVGGNGVVLASAPKGSPIYAVPAGRKGLLDDNQLTWVSSDRAVSCDVATPLFYQNRFFILNGKRKTLSCVEPRSGKVLWTGELESQSIFESSPTGGDGKVYCISHGGEVFVVEAADEFRLLHQTSMGSPEDRRVRSSVALSGGRLFIRTQRTLFCIE